MKLKIKKFKNLTPHALNIIKADGSVLNLPKPEDHILIPRVSITRELVDTIDGVDVYTSKTGEPIDLPEEEAGVGFVVSAMVRMNSPLRGDLFSPGSLLRDENGNITGCNGLDW